MIDAVLEARTEVVTDGDGREGPELPDPFIDDPPIPATRVASGQVDLDPGHVPVRK